MAKDTGVYRPVISRKEAQALLLVLQAGMPIINLTREDYAYVLRFMNKIAEREQMSQILDKLGRDIPDLIEDKDNEPPTKEIESLSDEMLAAKFSQWSDEMLEHFLIARPDADEAQWVQDEIARRKRQSNTE